MNPLCHACTSCGWFGLPRRQWCPACGGAIWRELADAEGVVAAVTHIQRGMAATLDERPIVLVSVGPSWMIGVAEAGVGIGDRVRLHREHAAVLASRA